MKTYRMDDGGLESYFRPSFVINSNVLWMWGLLLFQAWVYMLTINASLQVPRRKQYNIEETASESEQDDQFLVFYITSHQKVV
ncbi:uncharacterized protein [Blastocystis hominis]|uniref:Uncharacterized protein n=1 Tax=Blastocystis hominis TaxID=12968 RepID=D8M1S3_BLAHO|nr:uncharacterized protein [Blastocystis hominis]CBK22012.2 unnamed protein product [Blastocystis hominis]|eukprot:XP_012896060.1 uncharacterized protein [Blastocystis hominis]